MDIESAAVAVTGGIGLTISEQCRVLGISRSGYYNWIKSTRKDEKPEKPEKAAAQKRELSVLNRILELFLEGKSFGYRKMYRFLVKDPEFSFVTERLVRRIYRDNNLKGPRQMFKTTRPPKGKYYKFPYLLKGKRITYANQVWSSDITYIKLPTGMVYLTAIIDWYSRKILSWRLSDSMETSFCLEVLHEAIHKFGIPAIFNTDCGSQYLSEDFVEALTSYNIEISNDSVGRCLDNIRMERFWKTAKYEYVLLSEWRSITDLREGLDWFISFYNGERPHEALDYETPDAFYSKGCFPVLENSNMMKETA